MTIALTIVALLSALVLIAYAIADLRAHRARPSAPLTVPDVRGFKAQ